MTRPAPHWINPQFRLIESEQTFGWSDIDALASQLQESFPEHGRVAVGGQSVLALLAALVAAERARIEVVLKRVGMSRSGGSSLLIEPDGRLTRLTTTHDAVDRFAVLVPTSGTLGEPKLVRHDFIRLLSRIKGTHSGDVGWLLTYEATGFGGLQVVLSAAAAGAKLVARPGAPLAELAGLARAHGVTHISGTPTFWRAFLLLPDPPADLHTITLGGEMADQALLDRLAERYPKAHIGHLYASNEAGALFIVRDGRAGFPAQWLEDGVEGIGLRVRGGVLEVKSSRAMLGYSGHEEAPVTSDGWIRTGDMVEVVEGRVSFRGRSDGRVNVAGQMVSPEKVEQLILGVSGVQEAKVDAVANALTDHVLEARVVPVPGMAVDALRSAIHAALADLPEPERPRLIGFVDAVATAPSGKKMRVLE